MDSSFVAGEAAVALGVRVGKGFGPTYSVPIGRPDRPVVGLSPLSVLPSAPQPLIRHPKPPYQTSKMSLSVDIQNLVAVGGRLSLSLFPLKILPFPRTAPLPGLAGLTKESIGGILSAASG